MTDAGDPPKGLSILIVEDDDLSARTLDALLTHDAHTVEVVINGLVALDRLQGTTYDVIITDIYMPAMDGIELLRALRRRAHKTAIVAMSGG
ncbi:MAG: response regulator, partial [Myxococcales bacterium]|nr:response regulator [Myxococcales bacterium]